MSRPKEYKKKLTFTCCFILLLTAFGCLVDHGELESLNTKSLAGAMVPQSSDEVIRIDVEAEVTVVMDPELRLGGSIEVGDLVAGFYEYAESGHDTDPAENVGRYGFVAAPAAVEMKASGLTFRSEPDLVDLTITVVNDDAAARVMDRYRLSSTRNLQVLPGVDVLDINLSLVDPRARALSSDSLIGTIPRLADWPFVYELKLEGGNWQIIARISAINGEGIDQPDSRAGTRKTRFKEQ